MSRDGPSRAVAQPLPLADREREILEQVVQGFTTKEIARTLQLSPRTVEVHRGHILHKLGARNTADLVRKAVEAHDTLQDAMGG